MYVLTIWRVLIFFHLHHKSVIVEMLIDRFVLARPLYLPIVIMI